MIKKIYCMKDKYLGFMSPFTDSNDDVAKRNFAFACERNEIINFRAEDFSLFRLGEFNDESGTIESYEPIFIMDAIKKGDE